MDQRRRGGTAVFHRCCLWYRRAAGRGPVAARSRRLAISCYMDSGLPICKTCGVQYGGPRADCPICLDERQYVGWDGQQWTTLAELRAAGHRGRVQQEGPGVVGIGAAPPTAIGQRALLLRTPGGNVLWDMITYIDDDVLAEVRELGGVSAIAVSHPHFYGSMIEWAHALDAPVYIHAKDRRWVARPDDAVVFWDGAGALFSGDIVTVVPDRRWVSFMYSYPNHIPERPRTIRRALDLIEPLRFDRVYGAWWQRIVHSDGAAAIRRSAERYLSFALDDNRS